MIIKYEWLNLSEFGLVFEYKNWTKLPANRITLGRFNFKIDQVNDNDWGRLKYGFYLLKGVTERE